MRNRFALNSEEQAPPRPLLNRNRKFPLRSRVERHAAAASKSLLASRCLFVWDPFVRRPRSRSVGSGITDEGANGRKEAAFVLKQIPRRSSRHRGGARSRASARTSEKRAGPAWLGRTSMRPENAEMRRDRQTTFIKRPRDGRGQFP